MVPARVLIHRHLVSVRVRDPSKKCLSQNIKQDMPLLTPVAKDKCEQLKQQAREETQQADTTMVIIDDNTLSAKRRADEKALFLSLATVLTVAMAG